MWELSHIQIQYQNWILVTLQTPPSDSTNEKSSFSSRYTIEKKLGTGGMGVVYKAYDNVLYKPCAVKVLLPNSQADAIIRFHQEAKMTARLSHANILTVLDFGQNEAGDLYLVMDFLDGESLHDLLKARGGFLPLREALGLFLQICAGLQHAHTQGVLHRDIKPSNIMLVRDERNALQVKIVDFGLAKVEGTEQSLTTTGMHVGSPIYMSPEQAQTDAVDHRADIYSLGCLMYKTLTGKAPLLGETFLVTLDKHINEIPKSINDVNPNLSFSNDLADLVAKTLEKNPDDRFQTCESLAEALVSLELSVYAPASPVVPVLDDRIGIAHPVPIADKQRFDPPLYMKVAAGLVLLLCLVVTVSLSKFDKTTPNVKVPSRDLVTDSLITSVLTDKLVCERNGDLTAQSEFSDADMDQLEPFNESQKQLSLSQTQVTGKEFSKLRKMKKLINLNLDETKIDDQCLKHVGKIKKLQFLSLNRDQIGDIGLSYISGLKNLKELRIQRTLISNLGLEALTKLEKLEFLDISGCAGLTGPGLISLSKMNSLRTLHVVQCPNISPQDVESLRQHLPGCKFVITGEVPEAESEAVAEKKRMEAEEEERLNAQRRASRETLGVFMEYKNDMQNPKFFRFFQSDDCWKPRKTYSNIANPRIVKCLQDKRLQKIMKDPEMVRRWRAKETWQFMERVEERLNTYMPPVDFDN